MAPFPGAGNDRTLRLFAFIDAGNVYGENEKLHLSEHARLGGLGISWISPAGAPASGYANPIRKFAGDRIQKLQFQIGTIVLMKYLFRQCLLSCAGLLALRRSAQAQEFRIGFVNTDRSSGRPTAPRPPRPSWSRSSPGARRSSTTSATRSRACRQVRARSADPVRSQRATRQKQLVEQDRDFQRKRREFQEDLNARKNEELQQVLERAKRWSSRLPKPKSTT